MKTAIEEKAILRPEEAIQLYGMSRRRFRLLINGKKRLPFVAMYGKRKLIIRYEFDKYLWQNPEEREWLKNGERKSREATGF
ncbi:MAG: DNA-binding protein [Clostridia bacterium]|nr:DNA-binding protein [Clostridia bacterium]